MPGPYDGPGAAEPWFLPAAEEEAPPPALRLDDWARAEAGQAARLARVAARFGALDDRLARGPAGWRQRLALREAADLAWRAGVRVAPERLALWLALREGGAEDAAALAQAAWAVRRLSGGPGPEAGPAAFLGRAGAAALSRPLAAAAGLHPVTRGALALALWSRAGPGRAADRLEAAVVAGRIAAAEAQGGAVFAPQAGGPTAGGDAGARLADWLFRLDQGLISAMRQLDALEAWEARARTATADLSGRTPPRLIAALAAWPMLSAPMAERLAGTSRAAAQRNLAMLEARGLVRELTGQGRFRFWAAAV